MKYVYLLQSINYLAKRYIGITENLRKRLSAHNSEKSSYTSKYCPWEIVVAIQFDDDTRTSRFEKHLKSGSGHAFAKRHLWPFTARKAKGD